VDCCDESVQHGHLSHLPQIRPRFLESQSLTGVYGFEQYEISYPQLLYSMIWFSVVLTTGPGGVAGTAMAGTARRSARMIFMFRENLLLGRSAGDEDYR
jgi:hypothetical protein